MDEEKNLQGRRTFKKYSMNRQVAEMISEVVQGLPKVSSKVGY